MLETTEQTPIELPDSPGKINPELYINRELSWLAFNRRVLEEAQSPANPLLERLKFLAIFSANLDEFFMIRLSGIKEQVVSGVTKRTASGQTPAEVLAACRAAVLPLMAECQRLLREELLPGLREEGVFLLRYDELTDAQREVLSDYYEREVFPVLTPLAIDSSRPFPFISNLNVNLAVAIEDEKLGTRFARVKVPEVLPRLVQLPPETCPPRDGQAAPLCYVWMEEVIAANLAGLFPGKRVAATCAFRITRDTDLEIQEDEAADLLETIEETVLQRRFGAVVRLSLDAHAPEAVRRLLVEKLEVTEDDVYPVDGPMRLSQLMELYGADRPHLKDPPFVPGTPAPLRKGEDIFAAVRRQDILLHHPFDSFAPVIGLIEAAARDPQVLAIKMTLYRVGRNSPIVPALMAAREEGKQVAVLVELKARFDEENNIGWARQLEDAGVHVAYGLIGLKTHAKLLLVVRKEADGLRRYVHLGTGNYNAGTARLYTDIGLLTADDAIGADVSELFNVLTGYSAQTTYRRLLVAPAGIRKGLLAKIEREIERQHAHGDGHLIFKFNALTDEEMAIALYRAAQAGVRVDLIVRGMCAVRPGIPGLSETMRVRSVVGRFLEHSRIFYFFNGGEEEVYIGSADLMERNLDRRVEQLAPLRDPRVLRYVRDTVLETYLRDNLQARLLQPDGTYLRLAPGADEPVSAQDVLLRLRADG